MKSRTPANLDWAAALLREKGYIVIEPEPVRLAKQEVLRAEPVVPETEEEEVNPYAIDPTAFKGF